MSLDLNVKSAQLLERLANAIYDREPNNPTPFSFKSNDILIVEDWFKQTMSEILQEMASY